MNIFKPWLLYETSTCSKTAATLRNQHLSQNRPHFTNAVIVQKPHLFTKGVCVYVTVAALRKMCLSTKPQPLYERCVCLQNRSYFTKPAFVPKPHPLYESGDCTKTASVYERRMCLRNRSRFTKPAFVPKPPPLYESGDCTKTASVYERRMCLRNRSRFTKDVSVYKTAAALRKMCLSTKPHPLYERCVCLRNHTRFTKDVSVYKTAAALRNHHLFLQTSLPCANSRQDSIKVSLVFFISAFVNRQPYQLQGIFSLKQNRVGL